MIVIADDTNGWRAGPLSPADRSHSVRARATRRAITEVFAKAGVSGEMVIRKGPDGHAFVTDGGHWIFDAHLGRIPDAPHLAGLLNPIPGVVEHGLFIGLAGVAMLAGAQGIRTVERRIAPQQGELR